MIPDPLSLLAFVVFFCAAVLATIRRPAYGLCVVIAVVPFALYQFAFGTTLTLEKAALAALFLGLWVHRGALLAIAQVPPRALLIAAAAVLAATAISIAQAQYPFATLRETFKALEYLIAFALCYAAYAADPDRALVHATIVGVSIAVCMLALSQELYGATSVLLMNGHPTPRIAGPLEGPNQLAGYFDVTLPLLIALAFAQRSALTSGALAICACTDVLTFSRGGVIGAVAGLLTVAVLCRTALLRSLTPLVGGTLAGTLIATVWGELAHSVGISRFWDFAPSAYAGGVGTRPLLWRAALSFWRAHPLLGIGAGNFERELPKLGIRSVHTHANSLYLQSLAEGGVVLFAANVAALCAALAATLRRCARSPFALGAAAATVALAGHQIVDLLVFYPKVGAWWWIVLALAVADAP